MPVDMDKALGIIEGAPPGGGRGGYPLESELEILPSGAKAGHGFIVCPPPGKRKGVMSPDPAKSGMAVPLKTGTRVDAPVKQIKTKKKKRAQYEEEEAVPQPPPEESCTLFLSVPGVGSIPTQYRYKIRGKGVLILGLKDSSYVPAPANPDTGAMDRVSFEGEGSYLYLGHSFVDRDGTDAIVLLRIGDEQPQKQEQATEEDDHVYG